MPRFYLMAVDFHPRRRRPGYAANQTKGGVYLRSKHAVLRLFPRNVISIMAIRLMFVF